MAQPIQSLHKVGHSEAAYPQASIERGEGGFQRTAALVGPNSADQGAPSKVNAPHQGYLAQDYKEGNQKVNIQSAVAGKQSDAIQQERLMVTTAAGKEADAQRFLADRNAEMLMASDGGAATFTMGLPGVADLVKRHAAEAAMMAQGINPQPYTSARLPTA